MYSIVDSIAYGNIWKIKILQSKVEEFIIFTCNNMFF